MDKHRMLFAKSDKFAYVHVAPVIPKAGPMQPMVLTLMPTASKMFTPSHVSSSAHNTIKAMYKKKNWLTRTTVSSPT